MVKNKKKFVIIMSIVSILFLTVIVMVINSVNSNNTIHRQLELGQRYLNELDYEQALVAFENVLNIDPKNVEAYQGIIEAYIQMGNYEEALEYATQGHELTGDDSLLERLYELQVSNGETRDIMQTDNSRDEGTGDLDSAYAACVVDGVYHNGYMTYELTEEEELLLDNVIAYTELGKYEECEELLQDRRYMELVLKFREDTQSVGEFGTCRIAYNGYKIYSCCEDYNRIRMALIPIDDGIGAFYDYYSYVDTNESLDYKEWNYIYSECVDGMYNGSFVVFQSFYANGELTRGLSGNGKVVNGLIDGRLEIQEHIPSIYEKNQVDILSSYAEFTMGEIKGEYRTSGWGERIIITQFYEDGEIRSYREGNLSDWNDDRYYLATSGGQQEEMGIVVTSLCEERDGAAFIYPY